MKGSYVIVSFLSKNSKISVGGLGSVFFKKGFYCYVGSARGAGGIEKRVGRHVRTCSEKRCNFHWHIDRFLSAKNVAIMNVYTSACAECRLSDAVGSKADESIKGFGCSDCNCRSHLHFFVNPPGGFLKLASARYEHENAGRVRFQGRNHGGVCQGNIKGP